MRLFKKKKPSAPASGPKGARAYAIGDVHGRLDLLHILLDEIYIDRLHHPAERDFIVFLGDLVDRGPDSRGVIDLLLRTRAYLPNPVFLMGNHEEMLLRIIDGDCERIWDWLNFGGYECARSYGVEVGKLATLHHSEAAELVRRAVPDSHRDFLEGFVDTFQFGNYLLVHAGVRPGVPLASQATQDLRWIREEFLNSTADHGFVVVHGHSISEEPDEQSSRIGIDTGAYASGVLTALCLEGTDRKYITARQ